MKKQKESEFEKTFDLSLSLGTDRNFKFTSSLFPITRRICLETYRVIPLPSFAQSICLALTETKPKYKIKWREREPPKKGDFWKRPHMCASTTVCEQNKSISISTGIQIQRVTPSRSIALLYLSSLLWAKVQKYVSSAGVSNSTQPSRVPAIKEPNWWKIWARSHSHRGQSWGKVLLWECELPHFNPFHCRSCSAGRRFLYLFITL